MKLFINGKWQEGQSKALASLNPANSEVIWECKTASITQVNEAVQAANDAFWEWSTLKASDRVEYLDNYRQILIEEKENLAGLISKETGKLLWECLGEVGAMIAKFDNSLKAFHERCTERSFMINDVKASTRFKPQGVVTILGPFNFPCHLPNGHIMPALIAGNTIVFKPSELTPMTGEVLVRLWDRAGLPKGVINLVQGGGDVGKALVEHKDVNGVFFTGSYHTGKAIMTSLAGHPEKILALEMGGNNPLVIHQCKDLKAAAQTTIMSAYITAGQRCTCARRLIIVDNDETDKFLNLLIGMTRNLKYGLPGTEGSFMGTVISSKAAENVIACQEKLRSLGAEILIESKISTESSALVSPGLLDSTAIKNLPDDECFGPLLQLIRVPDFDSAIREANKTGYGLSAALLSDDRELWEQFYARSRAGVVNWNRQTTGASGALPFGGVGKSGNHRPSAYFAAEYCSYPVASMETPELKPPALAQGIKI